MRLLSNADNEENHTPMQLQRNKNKLPERRLDRFRRTTAKLVRQQHTTNSVPVPEIETYSAWKVAVPTTSSTSPHLGEEFAAWQTSRMNYRSKNSRGILSPKLKPRKDDGRNDDRILSINESVDVALPIRSIKEKIARLYVPAEYKGKVPTRLLAPIVTTPVVTLEEVQAKILDAISVMASTQKQEFAAATVLQSLIRLRNARYSFSFIRSALRIQKTWRGMRPRLAFKPQKDAAVIIAREWRAYAGRKSYKRNINSRKIQTAWRCYVPRMQYLQYLRSFSAATTIEAAWRSFKCRSDHAVAMKSVTTVQRVCRGYTHRKTFKLHSKEREQTRLRQRSALSIQRNIRGLICRKVCTAMRYNIKLNVSATLLQSCWRCHDTRNRFWYTIGSVIALQGFMRGVVARLRYKQTIGSILISQSLLRRWLAAQRYSRMVEADLRQKASIKIQAMLRMAVTMASYKNHIRARIIQTAWRRHVPRMKYLRHIETTCAATQIQSAWRSFSGYLDFLYTLRSIFLIQRIVRGHLHRKLFAEKWEQREDEKALFQLHRDSAIDIQRLFRGSRGRTKCRKLQHTKEVNNAAITIQCAWRGYIKQQKYWITLGSAIRIQALVRGNLANFQFLRDVKCIITAQRFARTWMARKQTKQMALIHMLLTQADFDSLETTHASQTLQTWYRSSMKLKHHTDAVIKVQSFFRMVKAMVDREIMVELERRKRRKHRKKNKKSNKVASTANSGRSTSLIVGSQVVVGDNANSRGRPRDRSVFSRSELETQKTAAHQTSGMSQQRSRSLASSGKIIISLPKNTSPTKYLLPPPLRANKKQLGDERPRRHYLDDDSDAVSLASGSTASTYLRTSFSNDSSDTVGDTRTETARPVGIGAKSKNKLAAKGMGHRRRARSASCGPQK